MSTLRVQTGGRSYTFEDPRVVTIGRAPESDIVLTGATASRTHAEIRPDANGWSLVDVGSSSGTFVNGTRVTEVRVSGPTSVRFGSADGEEMTLAVEGATQRPAFPPPNPAAAGAPINMEQTIVPGQGPVAGAPGAPGPYGAPGAPMGPGVLVRIEGEPAKRFAPGTVVRIGRDPVNEVVVDDPTVSRLHATVEMRPDGWWYVDRSTAGTFHEEDRVTQRRLTEPATLMLGHPTAGVEVEVVPIVAAAEAQRALASKKRRRTALVLTSILAAFIVVLGGLGLVWWLGNDDESSGGGGNPPAAGEDTLSPQELSRAKLASVMIIAEDDTGTPIYTGSGSIISDTGLILTNSHVGKPSAPGLELGEDPAILLVALTSTDDAPVEVKYQAQPVVYDGVLDLAVLQIMADADGNAVDPSTLAGALPDPMPLGDITEVQTGDEIRALGFPGIATIGGDDGALPSLTVTDGTVSTFVTEHGIDDPRAWIDSDVRIGSGNSGGASINTDGELIGVNTEVYTEKTTKGAAGAFTGGSARIRTVGLAMPLIDAAESGQDYSSPYLDSQPETTPMGGDAEVTALGWATEGNQGCTAGKTSVPFPAAGEAVYAEFEVSGIPEDTPITIDLYGVDGSLLNTQSATWDGSEGCLDYPVTLDGAGVEGIDAVFSAGDDGEIEVHNQVAFK